MARTTFRMPDEFLIKLSRLGKSADEIIPRVLKAGGEIVEAKVKSNLKDAIGKDTKDTSRSTGELVSSLGVSPAKQDKNGNFNVKVGFSEPRRDGKSNAMIASVLEYGKHNQPPRPFMKTAKSASKDDCFEAMISAFEMEVEKL